MRVLLDEHLPHRLRQLFVKKNKKEYSMQHRYKLYLIFPCFTLAFLLLFYTINTTSAQTILPAEDIAEKALASTVYLEMKDTNDKTLGIGSGFFVKTNIIATNYHVIEGAANGTAKLVGKSRTYKIKGVTAVDQDNDLALLKVTAFGIRSLSLGDSDKVRIGETVYVAGNPKGLEGTFSDGIISSLRDEFINQRLQMTAPISPGSSGGPVLNKKGEVIGVSVAVHRALDAQNLNFAIPSKHLKKLLEKSKSAKPLSQGRQSASANTYLRWGNIKYELGDYAGAVIDYTMVILLQPNNFQAYVRRGVSKFHLEQHSAAIVDYDIAIQLQPNIAGIYLLRGYVKAESGRPFAAITDFDNVIRLQPDSVKAYISRGLVKVSLEQYIAAISDFDIAIRLQPDSVEAYVNRGLVKVSLEKYIAAISDFDIAIRLQPDNAEAYTRRGGVKALLEQYFAAISDFDTAIRLQPDNAEVYIRRGHVKSDLKQYAAAIKDYNIAIRLKPDYAAAYYARGISKLLLGHRLEANRDLQYAWLLAMQARDIELKTTVEEALRILNE